jgi:iron(II)-dependent oxidoreductase
VAANAEKTTPLAGDAERMLVAMDMARAGTLDLVAGIAEEDLVRVHSPIMSPLAWDLGHIAAYEDLWLGERLGGLGLLRPELAELYDAFETPRSKRAQIPMLGPAEARDYLAAVRERTSELIAERNRVLADGDGGSSEDALICEMVVRHELQHSETMRQTLAIAGLLRAAERERIDEPLAPIGEHPVAPASEEWAEIVAGPFAMGAGPQGFAYDNERPRHVVELPAFRIARRPVVNGSWMHFSEGGGYERREWWSDEGWAWKEEYDITHHAGVATGHPDAPVCHVSWFEADAFARALGARLPTEAEWERAASVSATGCSPTGGSGSAGTNGPPGVLEGIGRVWEWTSSHFDGYPGFAAHPYREYSEVFFGEGYRVLRGSCWATHPRVASLTFRNWDLPLRRQIFAGLRLARDA